MVIPIIVMNRDSLGFKLFNKLSGAFPTHYNVVVAGDQIPFNLPVPIQIPAVI